MGIFDIFSKKKEGGLVEVEEKGLSSSDAAFFFEDGIDDELPFDELSTEEQMKVMRNNTIVYACVMAKANAFQQARLVLQEKTSNGWVDRTEHAYLDAFKTNPWLTESDLFMYQQLHLNLTGKSFFWKWYNKAGMLSELWPVPPHWVKFALAPDSKRSRIVDGYIIDPQDGTKSLYVPVEDMCYTRYPDPLNLYDGLSPIQAASRPIQLDQKGEIYRGESMDAFSLPGLAIQIKDKNVSQSQKDDIRSVLRQKMGGDARKNALILNGSDVVVDVLNPLEKFDWNSYTHLNESRICMAFRVPPIVIGSLVGLENSPWANTGTAYSFFYKNTMTSEWDLATRTFNKWLIPDEDKNTLRYFFDTSVVPQMQEDAAETEKRSIDLFNSSVITLNEARAKVGLPEVPNADSFKQNAATLWVPIGETEGVPAYELRDPDNDPARSEDDDMGADIFGDEGNDVSEEVNPTPPDPADKPVGLN